MQRTYVALFMLHPVVGAYVLSIQEQNQLHSDLNPTNKGHQCPMQMAFLLGDCMWESHVTLHGGLSPYTAVRR